MNDGVTLATRDYGGLGSDVLFVPGAGQTLVDCDLLAPHLKPQSGLVGAASDGAGTVSAAV